MTGNDERHMTGRLETADGCVGTFAVQLTREGRIVEDTIVWDRDPDRETIAATLTFDDGHEIALTGDDWRMVEGEWDTDAFYRTAFARDARRT